MLRTDRQEVLLVLRLAWLELSLSRAAECEYVLSIGTQRPPTLLLACSACGTTTALRHQRQDRFRGARTSRGEVGHRITCPRSRVGVRGLHTRVAGQSRAARSGARG
jgi:hypothetical protein